MRFEVFLSFIIIALAFASGALVLSIKNGPSVGMSLPILKQQLEQFKKATSTLDQVRTDSISEFLDPQNIFPSYFRYDYHEVQSLIKLINTCKATKDKRSAALLKSWRWEDYKCSHQEIKEDFFLSPPYFHPSGHSFAYLANKDVSWIKTHFNLFHIYELRDLQNTVLQNVELPAPYGFLTSLDMNSLTGLTSGDSIVIGGPYVFLGLQDDAGYEIYQKSNWDAYWAATPFVPLAQTNSENCFSKENSICWRYDVKKVIFPVWNPLVYLLALSVVLALSIFILLAMQIYRRQKDQERLKFTLEMLAHEIRTPAANLTLAVENFRSHFDRFPDDTKAGLLRLFDQVERIKRVAESSRNYLGKKTVAELIITNFSEIVSLKEFINYTLDAYVSQIDIEIVEHSTSIILDPYWTSICIKNLVENALLHGVKPVRVRVLQNGKNWSIEVSDQGTEKFDLAKKGSESSGFGLGLKIVKNILPQLYARMTISYTPTRIIIFFGDNP